MREASSGLAEGGRERLATDPDVRRGESMKPGRIWLALLLTICLPGSVAAGSITFDDLYALPRALDPRISPDGKRM